MSSAVVGKTKVKKAVTGREALAVLRAAVPHFTDLPKSRQQVVGPRDVPENLTRAILQSREGLAGGIIRAWLTYAPDTPDYTPGGKSAGLPLNNLIRLCQSPQPAHLARESCGGRLRWLATSVGTAHLAHFYFRDRCRLPIPDVLPFVPDLDALAEEIIGGLENGDRLIEKVRRQQAAAAESDRQGAIERAANEAAALANDRAEITRVDEILKRFGLCADSAGAQERFTAWVDLVEKVTMPGWRAIHMERIARVAATAAAQCAPAPTPPAEAACPVLANLASAAPGRREDEEPPPTESDGSDGPDSAGTEEPIAAPPPAVGTRGKGERQRPRIR